MIFHDKMLPSEFLQVWFSNDYLGSFPREKKDFEKYYRGYINNKFLRHTQNSYNHNLSPAIDIVRNHPQRPLRLLEVGSGCGTESLYFALIGCDVVGVELIKKLFNVAQVRKKIVRDKLNKSLKLKFKNLSFMDYDDKAKFDLIWMEQTFHHLEPRDLMIKKISSLLKPGGYLVISEANAYNPIGQIFWMRERFRTHKNPFKTIIHYKDEDGTVYLWGHERILPAYKLVRLFSKEGIIMEIVDYFKLLPNRAGLSITKKNSRHFFDNNFTLWLSNFLENKIPVFLKRLLAFSYNYVGKKSFSNYDS